MKQDQEPKCYLCKFCNQSFSNGKKLGGHMRCHFALISASRKKGTREIIPESINGENGFNLRKQGIQENHEEFINGEKGSIVRKLGIQENDQESINGEKGIDFDDDDCEIVKKSRQIYKDFDANGRKQGIQESDEEFSNVYALRENPKRSWRVSNSSKDYGNFCVQCGKGFHSSKALDSHERCHLTKVSIKKNVCEKCGKGFDSDKALYGHMRCHSVKRSPSISLEESTAFSSSDDHGGVAKPVRKKRSCTMYKSPMPNDNEDGEVENGAICLMMLSRGLRDLDGVKLVISNQAEFSFSDSGYSRTVEKNVESEVSVDNGSKKFCEFKSKNDLGLKKDLIFGCGSGQVNPGQSQSTLVKYKSTKKPMSYCQDLMDRDVTNAKISVELKKKSKDYKCLICFKEFTSGQALGSHKRVHNNTESKVMLNYDIRKLVDFNLEGGLNDGDVEFKQKWVHSDIEGVPLPMAN